MSMQNPTLEEITRMAADFAANPELPNVKLGYLNAILLMTLQEHWQEIPEIAKGALLGISGQLIRLAAQEVMASGLSLEDYVRREQGGVQ